MEFHMWAYAIGGHFRCEVFGFFYRYYESGGYSNVWGLFVMAYLPTILLSVRGCVNCSCCHLPLTHEVYGITPIGYGLKEKFYWMRPFVLINNLFISVSVFVLNSYTCNSTFQLWQDIRKQWIVLGSVSEICAHFKRLSWLTAILSYD